MQIGSVSDNNLEKDVELSIIDKYPIGGSIKVETNTEVMVTFNQDIEPFSFNQDNLIMMHGDTIVSGDYDIQENIIYFYPTTDLSFSTTYSIFVSNNEHNNGEVSLSSYWTFTTCDSICSYINTATA